MSEFRNRYSADLGRYDGHSRMYERIFLYLLRKAQLSTIKPIRKIWLWWFRLHAQRRGIEMSPNMNLGAGLYLSHAYNITINPKATIGCNCNIHKNVLIGQTNRGRTKGTPTIGDNVWFGMGSCVVGNVTVGDDVLIAPNSFINCDIPSHSVVFGNPCIIKHRDNATEGYINNVNY